MAERPLVLVVDDHEDSRMILRTVLEYAGYRVLDTEGGRSGVRMARRYRPAVVLVELDMRGWSGFETIDALRLAPELAATPVVAMASADRGAEAIAGGFSAFVGKPFEINGLLTTVRELQPPVPN